MSPPRWRRISSAALDTGERREGVMKVGVLGTGDVGTTIASALVAKGHEVKLGSRTADNADAVGWANEHGDRASNGTFADAASFGSIVFHCGPGRHALDNLEPCREALHGKVLVDVSNPLDPSQGFPPKSLYVANTDSVAEQIQRAIPEVRVVKALNTLAAPLMVDASRVPDSVVFVAGNDAEAKANVVGLLHKAFGWPKHDVIDLGDIVASRALEMLVMMWVRIYRALDTEMFNYRLVRAT
jgi:predicted dinucleotide-binding enzyme